MDAQRVYYGEPAESPFDDPAFGQDFESVQFCAFDHFQAQAAARQEFLEPLSERTASITAIDSDQSQAAEGMGEFLQHQPCSVAILNVGGMNHDGQDQPRACPPGCGGLLPES